MRIRQFKVQNTKFKLTRPYTIAYKTRDSVDNVILEIILDNGERALGAASPCEEVTRESLNDCLRALQDSSLEFLLGKKIQQLPEYQHTYIEKLKKFPAACAALDMALLDLYARSLQLPLVKLLGQVHYQLPTSITIGIKNTAATLAEANEYIERGFYVLKVKLGKDLKVDIQRLVALRQNLGDKIVIRVDPNQGYSITELQQLFIETKDLNLEFIEQPLDVRHRADLYSLSENNRKKIALDENLITPQDAIDALQPSACCGIFNIKLMKCGGIYPALQIAKIAEAAKIDLMWGCNDESVVSITAALHAAFACRATKYIDLDGSLDLAEDIAKGGFVLKNGIMTLTDKPGLGIDYG